MKFVTYKRLSKKDTRNTQYGFDSQQMDIDFYLSHLPQNEFEVVGSFQEFISGTSDIKPQLEKALEVCRQTGATLLVAKLDRLSRRVSQIAKYMEGTVPFKVCSIPSATNFQLHIYAALAEEERNIIAARIKRGLAAAKAKGVKLGGANPKWKESMERNKHNHKTTRLSEESKIKRSPITQMIKDMIDYSQNRLTLDEIASNLNNKGITTSQGKSFSKATVSRIIKQDGLDYKKKNKYRT
ncbi:recombinase family protein [uncultured Vibrio sp.]|uniref:recombinase family protein n=1 Tax=uncultured Vibrio sp. TaxID=114054 RepID=UPI0026387DBC|nr:recombinase family protein [uncultured Vibrio sp.]